MTKEALRTMLSLARAGLVLGCAGAACDVYVDGPPARAPRRVAAQPPPPAAPAPRPVRVVPLHLHGTAQAPTGSVAPPAAATSCLDDSAATVADCGAMPAPDPSCAASSTARARCAAYQASFNPRVAAVAIACMSALSGTQQCDPSQADTCAKSALVQACADSTVSQLCGIASTSCKTSASECSTMLSGLNDQGKQQVAQCVAQGCLAGLLGCLQTLH